MKLFFSSKKKFSRVLGQMGLVLKKMEIFG